jgi:hypothetical protein
VADYGYADPLMNRLGITCFDGLKLFEVIIKEEVMGKIVHTSHITITREMGPTRKAVIKGFDEPVYYGVHGGIKNFYKVDPEKEHAATLDHIVGAVGG